MIQIIILNNKFELFKNWMAEIKRFCDEGKGYHIHSLIDRDFNFKLSLLPAPVGTHLKYASFLLGS